MQKEIISHAFSFISLWFILYVYIYMDSFAYGDLAISLLMGVFGARIQEEEEEQQSQA